MHTTYLKAVENNGSIVERANAIINEWKSEYVLRAAEKTGRVAAVDLDRKSWAQIMAAASEGLDSGAACQLNSEIICALPFTVGGFERDPQVAIFTNRAVYPFSGFVDHILRTAVLASPRISEKERFIIAPAKECVTGGVALGIGPVKGVPGLLQAFFVTRDKDVLLMDDILDTKPHGGGCIYKAVQSVNGFPPDMLACAKTRLGAKAVENNLGF